MATNLIAKAEITIDSSVDKVWEALTNPLLIKEYMFGATVISDWVKDSSITWQGEFNGNKFEDKGKILEIISGKRLSYSHYSPLSKLPDIPENYHRVTIDLTAENSKTKVTLTQDKNGSEREFKEAEKNWKQMLLSLKKLLEKK